MLTQLPNPADRTRPTWSVLGFVFAFALLNALLFQRPLFLEAWETLPPWDAGAWGVLAPLMSLFVLQLMLTLAFLMLLGMLLPRALKLVCVLLMLCNAVALYFMDTYNVVLDKTMMGNVFNTNSSESFALLQPKLFAYLVLYALIPAFFLSRIAVLPGRWWHRLAWGVGSVLGCAVLLYANASSWLWIDKHASRFGSLMLPWSYAINGARHWASVANTAPAQQLPDAKAVGADEPALVVLVIGEAARAQNFSLYAYARQTNPLLASLGVAAMPDATACATYTTESIRCMLSHEGGGLSSTRFEALPNYLQRQGVHVSWRSNNWGEPPLQVAQVQRADELAKACASVSGADCSRMAYDEVLLQGLAQELNASATTAKKRLVVLHQMGSHGPQYHARYPAEFEVFKPVCKTVDLGKCDNQELVNAYDNSLRYTDFFLSRVIATLQSSGTAKAVMIYMADHGESLGEFGLYLHGTPYALAPDVQKKVPFLVWTSPAFAAARGGVSGLKPLKSQHSHDDVFHSVMGALALTSPVYKASNDVFAPQPTSPQRAAPQ